MAPLVQHLTHVSLTSMVLSRIWHVLHCPDCKLLYLGRRQPLLPY